MEPTMKMPSSVPSLPTLGAWALLAMAALVAAAPAHADRGDRGHRHGHPGWYAGHQHHWYGWHGWRPHVGLRVYGLPSWRSVVVIGGASYLVADGIYYRQHVDGGYVVVPEPVTPVAALPPPDTAPAPRQYVYPRQGQSPERQSADEYDCHRWAADQSGFDPAAAATGHAAVADARRPDYQRARSACLEGRGYTVR
jgi:hypothetical protein